MKLDSGDGVLCDICKSEHRNFFEYYSYDRFVIKSGEIPSSLTDPVSESTSRDLCQKCNEKIIDSILLSNKNTSIRNLKFGTFCELSGNKIDNIDYFMYRVRMVKVDLSGPSVYVDKDYFSFCSTDIGLEEIVQ